MLVLRSDSSQLAHGLALQSAAEAFAAAVLLPLPWAQVLERPKEEERQQRTEVQIPERCQCKV